MKDLYGLFGEVLVHSYSPRIHSSILKKLNIPGYYHLFEMKKEDLKTAVEGLKVLGAKGVNVTIPHKLSVIKHLDELSQEASRIGSVNTIVFSGGRTIGYNTDYFGIERTFKKYGVDLKDKKVVVLGSGGAAVTVLHYLKDNHIGSLTVVSRSAEKAEPLKTICNFKITDYNNLDVIDEGDVLINTTPCGMYPHIEECPVTKGFISRFSAVFDLIYNPSETVLVKHASELGLKSINGLYMLVSQAIYAQELWNNIKIDDSVIDEVYTELLNN